MVAARRVLAGARAAATVPGAPRPSAGSSRLTRLAVNVAAAIGTAFFTVASLQFYLDTHRLIGVGYLAQQAWFVLAFLVRRPARSVTRRTTDWLLALGGSFGGTLFRPSGLHPAWGVWSGLVLQGTGLVLGVAALIVLGRSFGVAPADRGLVTRGPYAVVRHPIYSSYLLVECGYLLQSQSWRNVLVCLLVTGCNVGRALAEERLLTEAAATAVAAAPVPAARPAPGPGQEAVTYATYRARVRWRLVPGLW